jgi:hypothetical protein
MSDDFQKEGFSRSCLRRLGALHFFSLSFFFFFFFFFFFPMLKSDLSSPVVCVFCRSEKRSRKKPVTPLF